MNPIEPYPGYYFNLRVGVGMAALMIPAVAAIAPSATSRWKDALAKPPTPRVILHVRLAERSFEVERVPAPPAPVPLARPNAVPPRAAPVAEQPREFAATMPAAPRADAPSPISEPALTSAATLQPLDPAREAEERRRRERLLAARAMNAMAPAPTGSRLSATDLARPPAAAAPSADEIRLAAPQRRQPGAAPVVRPSAGAPAGQAVDITTNFSLSGEAAATLTAREGPQRAGVEKVIEEIRRRARRCSRFGRELPPDFQGREVSFRIVVDLEGRVAEISRLTPLPPEVAALVEREMRSWRFTPPVRIVSHTLKFLVS